MPKIHPTAVVAAEAKIADDVEIGPLCVVGPDVTIGAGCRLHGSCSISGHTTLGQNNRVFPGAALGGEAEDHSSSYDDLMCLEIGDGNIFRENTTVNRGTVKGGAKTVVGSHCFMMAGSHVAHDCVVGDHAIFVVQAALGGHVTVGDHALISGMCAVHQFCRIGRHAVLSGGSAISLDLPPFMIGEGRNGAVKSLNLVGLKRAGFSLSTVRTLKDLLRIFFRSGLNVTNALNKIAEELEPIPEVLEFVEFVKASKRGVLHGRDVGRRS